MDVAAIVWISRISLISAFIVSLFICYRNYCHKKLANDIIKTAKYRYLNLFASITIYISPICIMIHILEKAPLICIFASPLGLAFAVIPKITLSYFQLSRLQICFSQKKQDSIPMPFAYPKYVMNLLYLFGILIFFTAIGLSIYEETHAHLYHQTTGHGCYIHASPQNTIFGTAILGTWTLWDWVIVGLYVKKLRDLKQNVLRVQIDPHHSNNAKTRQVLDHINLQLNKVLFLTIIMEIVTIVILQLHIWDVVSYDILGWIDLLNVMMIQYLMLEWNEFDYLRFLLFWIRIGCIRKCCCCFKNLTSKNSTDTASKSIAASGKHDVSKGNENIMEGDVEKGKTESLETNSMEVQELEYVDQSMKTQTEIA